MSYDVASTAAFQPLPYQAVYGASKAFVLSFSLALWAEYRKRGRARGRPVSGADRDQFFHGP